MKDGQRPCDECGLPLVECSELVMARKHLESNLRMRGYTGMEAYDASYKLIPEPKRK